MNDVKVSSLQQQSHGLMRQADVVIWDFDGVIKESVDVKTEAFADAFKLFGAEIVDKVVAHHKMHTGMSRFEKVPLYFKEFVGRQANISEVNEVLNFLSSRLIERVVNSEWVPGAREYLEKHSDRQDFFWFQQHLILN